MPDATHIADDELLALLDGELSPERASTVGSHLSGCGECRNRSLDLQRAASLYSVFHDEVLRPSLEPSSWPVLKLEQPRRNRTLWWIAAAACVLAGILLFFRETHLEQSYQMTALLDRAESVEAPAGEQIQIRMNGVAFLRPALLTTMRPQPTRK